MTLVELTAFLESKGVLALVVQFYDGAWRASTRRADGVGPRGVGSTMEFAIRDLYLLFSMEGS